MEEVGRNNDPESDVDTTRCLLFSPEGLLATVYSFLSLHGRKSFLINYPSSPIPTRKGLFFVVVMGSSSLGRDPCFLSSHFTIFTLQPASLTNALLDVVVVIDIVKKKSRRQQLKVFSRYLTNVFHPDAKFTIDSLVLNDQVELEESVGLWFRERNNKYLPNRSCTSCGHSPVPDDGSPTSSRLVFPIAFCLG